MIQVLTRIGRAISAPAVCLFCLAAPALAEDVVYPGSPLSNIGSTFYQSLAPSGSYNGGSAANNKSYSLVDNTVTVNSGTIGTSGNGGNVYGAINNNDAGSVTGNRVFINGGRVVGYVFGGYNGFGSAPGGAARDNSVTISGSAVIGDDVKGGYSFYGAASGNSVTIRGGVFDPVSGSCHIFGGDSGYGTTTHNTVTIYGAPIGLEKMTLLGGSLSTTTDAFTGNTLNLGTANLTVRGLDKFQYLNFHLPASWGAGDTMLGIASTGTANLTDSHTGLSSVVSLSIDSAASLLKTGDQLVLIDASAGTLTGTPENATAVALQGATLKYDFDLLADAANNKLLATVRRAGADERALALPEGFLAGLALVRQGA